MWSLTKIRLVNLYSHVDTTFSPKHLHLTQITGLNKDDDGADSNGSGKSTLIDGINLALLGETYRDTDKDNFINDKANSCTVEAELFNPFLVRTMKVVRNFYRGGKTMSAELWINEERQKNIVNVRDVTKKLLAQIGITKEDLENYYLIGQGNTNCFFSAGDTTQKEIIARFSNFAALDGVLEGIDLELQANDKLLNENEGRLQAIQERISFLEEQLVGAESRFEEEKAALIKAQERLVATSKAAVLSDRKVYEDTLGYIKTLETQFQDLNAEIAAEKDTLDTYNALLQEHAEMETQRKETVRLKKHYENYLAGTITCPNCEHKFVVDGEYLVEDAENALQTTLEVEAQIIVEIGKKDVEIRELQGQIAEINGKKQSLKQLRNTIAERKMALKPQEKFKLASEKRYKEATEELARLKSMTATDNYKRLEDELQQSKQGFKQTDDRLTSIRAIQNDLNFYRHHFGKSGLKTYLSNKTIKNIEDITNFYLRKFYTNLAVKINGYKTLKDGTIREKIDVFIVRNGLEEGNFNKYSGGERSRINLCSILALQKLINNSCESGGLNLLALDEYITYLDGTGLSESVKILNSADVTTLLVVHNHFEPDYNYVVVEKENGQSKLLNQ